MKRTSLPLPGLVCALLCFGFIPLLAQGPLTPVGAPAPTFKTLDQVEPRRPISSLPFTISEPGSYYVTTNLSSSFGISITANHVTLDLGGFALSGVAAAPLSGIDISGTQTNISIRNGVLQGWGSYGISAFNAVGLKISEVHVSGCVQGGIAAGRLSVIENCIAIGNEGTGIAAEPGSRIVGCVAGTNRFEGIAASNGRSTIQSCSAEGNSIGIFAGATTLVADCTANRNRDNGIFTGADSEVRNCYVRENGTNGIFARLGGSVRNCTALNNGVDGIRVESRGTVTGNHCEENGANGDGAGIRVLFSSNRIEGNHVLNNDYGIFIQANAFLNGNLVIRNSALGNTTNYVVGSDNIVGPIVTRLTIGTNQNPHANYTFN